MTLFSESAVTFILTAGLVGAGVGFCVLVFLIFRDLKNENIW